MLHLDDLRTVLGRLAFRRSFRYFIQVSIERIEPQVEDVECCAGTDLLFEWEDRRVAVWPVRQVDEARAGVG